MSTAPRHPSSTSQAILKKINHALRGPALGSVSLATAAPTTFAATPGGVVAALDAIQMTELAPAEAELGRFVDIQLDRAVVGAAADEAPNGTAYVFKKDQSTFENGFFRYKAKLGGNHHASGLAAQKIEVTIKCKVLDRMLGRGRSKSVAITR